MQHTMGQMPIDLGFTGVSVFFGLSGYLITSLLLDEFAARGSVSLRSFYLRRAARLVPALLLVVVVCNALFALQGDYGPLKGSVPAITYTANYAEVLNGRLVAAYGPTWSLAIEEHFYLLWPLVLLTLVTRFGLKVSLRATLALCAVDLLWRAIAAAIWANYTLLSIGSLERADSLLYGCAAAIAVRMGWRPPAWVVWAGVCVIAAAPFLFHTEGFTAMVPGSALLGIATAAVVVGLDYAAPKWLRDICSLRAVVAIGVLSYGIYLWHGPLMRLASDLGYSGRAWRLVAASVSVVAAAASHRYLEAPIRSWARRRATRIRVRGIAAPVEVTTVAPGGDWGGR
jgi:peptidoglycan/LPS O-acetylase OafA/YrhL